VDEFPISEPPSIESAEASTQVAVKAPETSAERSPAPMAVHADNLALGELVSKDPQRRTAPRELRDVIALGPNVVELEHHPVIDPAVGAGVASQMILDEHSCRGYALAFGRLSLVAMELAAISEIGPKAFTAPSLPARPQAVERALGENPHTAWADLEGFFPCVFGRYRIRNARVCRQLNSAKPQAGGRERYAQSIRDFTEGPALSSEAFGFHANMVWVHEHMFA